MVPFGAVYPLPLLRLPLKVQDAGLIFLSTMASSVVGHCKAQGASDAATISTVETLGPFSAFDVHVFSALVFSKFSPVRVLSLRLRTCGACRCWLR